MRPRYVRPEDVVNEAAVVGRFAKLIPNSYFTISGGYYDAEVYADGKLACLCEVKGRSGSGARFDTWHVAKQKLERLQAAGKVKGMPVFMIFSWGSEAFYWKVANIDQLEVRQGGRWDRGDVHDVEQMAHIPRSYFKRIP